MSVPQGVQIKRFSHLSSAFNTLLASVRKTLYAAQQVVQLFSPLGHLPVRSNAGRSKSLCQDFVGEK